MKRRPWVIEQRQCPTYIDKHKNYQFKSKTPPLFQNYWKIVHIIIYGLRRQFVSFVIYTHGFQYVSTHFLHINIYFIYLSGFIPSQWKNTPLCDLITSFSSLEMSLLVYTDSPLTKLKTWEKSPTILCCLRIGSIGGQFQFSCISLCSKNL